MYRLIALVSLVLLGGCDVETTAPESDGTVVFDLQTGSAEVGKQNSACPGNVCWTPLDADGWGLTGRVTVSKSSLEAAGPGARLSGEVDLQELACMWEPCFEDQHATTTAASSGSYGLEAKPGSRYLMSLYNGAMIFEGDPVDGAIHGQVIWMMSTGPNGFQFRAPFTMTPVPS